MTAAWMDNALCQHFPDLPWIAEPDQRSGRTEAAMAVVCAACPVLATCERYVAQTNVTSGFWAAEDRTLRGRDGATGAA